MSSTARKLDDPKLNIEALAESHRLSTAIDRYYAQISRLNLTYLAVSLDLIVLHQLPDVALFVAEGGHSDRLPGEYKLFRGKGMYVSQAELDSLSQSGVTDLYIQRADVPHFTQYVEALLDSMDSVSPMADEHKVGLLRKSAMNVMSDIIATPSAENIQRGVKAVSGFVYVLMRDPKAYQLLLSLSSHDHYTLQHSVGVATTAIILAKKMGINDEAGLIEAGVGGLLHDIGKTRISKDIINKKGPLDEAEWAEMKKHSLWGYEMLKENPQVGMRAKLAVLQHHEDSNGTGYPMGLRLEQVSIFAKIVTISDIFNAITTDRSYSKAKSPFEAFKLIKDKLMAKVDPKLYEALVHIYGGKP